MIHKIKYLSNNSNAFEMLSSHLASLLLSPSLIFFDDDDDTDGRMEPSAGRWGGQKRTTRTRTRSQVAGALKRRKPEFICIPNWKQKISQFLDFLCSFCLNWNLLQNVNTCPPRGRVDPMPPPVDRYANEISRTADTLLLFPAEQEREKTFFTGSWRHALVCYPKDDDDHWWPK